MIGLPGVVIVGRPNVGKSTLFNALAGQRVAIEDPMAGVTRDRVSFILDGQHNDQNCSVELIDTGGIGQVDEAELKDEIEEQIAMALDLADLVIFVVDGKSGILPQDHEVAKRLRRLDVPVMLIANKIESVKDESGAGEASALGFGDVWRISAKERLGIVDLRDEIFERLGEAATAPMMPMGRIRLGIVGRMNVGKSTLVNALVGSSRVIVSSVPGTTRDAVDVPFTSGGQSFVAIDTAGMRKSRVISDSVEFYGQSRAQRAIRRSDVVLLLVDATRDIGKIDKQIAGTVVESHVPVVIVVTKWDLVGERSDTATYETYLRKSLRGLAFAPIAFISSTMGLNLEPTLALASELYDQAGQRVSTGEINRVIRRAYDKRKPRAHSGHIGKLYYASQVSTYPPTIVVFVNVPNAFEDSWLRFLVHELQQHLPFAEVPIRVRLSARGRASGGSDG